MPATIALALPVRPGMLDAWLDFIMALEGPRAAEHAAHQARCGVVREAAFHQPTPQGDIVILTVACEDPALYLGALARPHEDFDRWYLARLEAIHGITPEVLAQLRPGELVATWPAPEG
jgi:hypothetical protein